MTTTTLQITGMTCGHCVQAVTDELTALDGVQGIDIELVAGGASTVRLTSQHPLDGDTVRAAVDEAGYELVDD